MKIWARTQNKARFWKGAQSCLPLHTHTRASRLRIYRWRSLRQVMQSLRKLDVYYCKRWHHARCSFNLKFKLTFRVLTKIAYELSAWSGVHTKGNRSSLPESSLRGRFTKHPSMVRTENAVLFEKFCGSFGRNLTNLILLLWGHKKKVFDFKFRIWPKKI